MNCTRQEELIIIDISQEVPCLKERHLASHLPIPFLLMNQGNNVWQQGKSKLSPGKAAISTHWIKQYRGKNNCNLWYQNEMLQENNECFYPCCSQQNNSHFLQLCWSWRKARGSSCTFHSGECCKGLSCSQDQALFIKHPDCASISRHSHCFFEPQLGITRHTSNGAGGWDLCGLG